MVKVSDSLRAGGVEIIHEKPEGTLAGAIFGALFYHNQQQSELRPATAPKHLESRRAPAWGDGDVSQAAGADDAGHDDTTNPVGIDFTEEDFHYLERKWGIHDLQEVPAGSHAGPSGSGRIGGSVYTPDSDESKLSDKRAVAVGFGCTYIAGNASVVMINDVGESPSVDGERETAWASVGGGDSGGGGGGGGNSGDGDTGRRTGMLREPGVQNGSCGRPCKLPLSTYTPSEGTSDDRTYSCSTARVPEGTPEVVSMAVTRRQHSTQDTDVPALFSAVDPSFTELFPSFARLHDVGPGPQSNSCDAGMSSPAKYADAAGLSRGTGPGTSGGGTALVETPADQKEVNSSKYTPPLSPPSDIGSASSSGSAALCGIPIKWEEVDLVERVDMGSPSHPAGLAMSGGCKALCETPIKRKEVNLAKRVDPGSHSRDVGPVMSGERACGSPFTVEENEPCEATVPVSASRVARLAKSGGGAAACKAPITFDEGDSAECMVLASPSRDAGPCKRCERTRSRGRKTVDEEVNLETCAGWLFSGAFGLYMENRGREDDVLASVARAPDATSPAAPATDDDTLRPDYGSGCGGSVAATSSGTKAPLAPGGYTLRSSTAFLKRTAGAVAAGFFGGSPGSARVTPTGFHDNSAAKSEGVGWRKFPGSVPRDRSVWYHAWMLAPVSTQVV